MRRLLIVCAAFGGFLVAGCEPKRSPESYEYRFMHGTHADDHRNLQWRMEKIESKLDEVLKRTAR